MQLHFFYIRQKIDGKPAKVDDVSVYTGRVLSSTCAITDALWAVSLPPGRFVLTSHSQLSDIL